MSNIQERLQLLQRNSWSSTTFDLLRWIAAAYVVVFHLRPVLFAGLTTLHNPNVLVKALYVATSLGYQFVMLFFVLSGYLIASNVLKSMAEGKWSWKVYLVNRLTRLWIVLIPALILSTVLAKIELSHFHDATTFAANMNWTVFFGNMFFAQGVLVPNFAQNLPLWSLAYEFWYYILFPCLVLALVSRRWLVRIAYTLVVIGLAVFLGKNIMLYFLIWLLGAALVLLPRYRISVNVGKRVMIPITLVVLVAVLFAGKEYVTVHHLASFDMVGGFPPDFLVSLVFAALLYIVLHTFNNPLLQKTGILHWSAVLANFSYTLYLTHYPIINILRVWFGNGEWGVWQPDARHLLFGVGILACIFFYAYVVAYCTEARTSLVRASILRLLGSSRSAARTLPVIQDAKSTQSSSR